MSHQNGPWNQLGFRAKTDVCAGLAQMPGGV